MQHNMRADAEKVLATLKAGLPAESLQQLWHIEFCYRHLIGHCLRTGTLSESVALLKDMQAHGIRPADTTLEVSEHSV